jgi:hypothetical protein
MAWRIPGFNIENGFSAGAAIYTIRRHESNLRSGSNVLPINQVRATVRVGAERNPQEQPPPNPDLRPFEYNLRCS